MTFETTGEILGGRLKLHDRQGFETAFAMWSDGPVWARFDSAMVFRSAGQNRYYHAAIVNVLAKHCGVSARAMHEALKVKFLPEGVRILNAGGMVLETITIGGSTARLTRHEASNLIDRAVALMEEIPLDVPPRPVVEETHWIPWDSPKIGRYQQRAACGALVASKAHANQPTCQACAARLAEEAEMRF